MRLSILLSLFYWVVFFTQVCAQPDTLRVLFLGNSYTAGNNLPKIIEDLSSASGKVLISDQNTPGGHTLQDHSTNPQSLQKIRTGNWDYVVLQEQSQIPTIDFYRYGAMYPAAVTLADTIRHYNPCANVVMFMTWGRQFGGQQCDGSGTHCSPVFVDFSHMQDSLESAYVEIADSVDAYVAPVGISWKSILEDTALILHTTDQSHPNMSGSYLAACSFFSTFWQEPVFGNTYRAGLSASQALYLQEKSDSVVFQSLTDWNHSVDRPLADFSYTQSVDTIWFTNSSRGIGPLSFIWDFGDGSSSTANDPVHVYSGNGNYAVSLVVRYCNEADTIVDTVEVSGIITDLDNDLKPTRPFRLRYENGVAEVENLLERDVRIEIYDLSGRKVYRALLKAKGKRLIFSKRGSEGYKVMIIREINSSAPLFRNLVIY